MTYNPRIKNSDNGTVRVSGSVAVNKTGTNISCSNLTVDNSLTFSNTTGSTGKLSISSFSGIKTPIRKVSDNTDISTDDHVVLVDASSKYVKVTLPSSSQVPGQQFVVKKTDSTNNPIRIIRKTQNDIKQTSVLSGSLAIQISDAFGNCVSINSAGDRLVVGVPDDEKNTATASTGLAYVFTSGSSGWTESAILSGSLATQASDQFGLSVCINSLGDRLVVGVPDDEKNTATASTGLAYVFTSGSSGWTESAILSGSLAVDLNDNFGQSVSMNSIGDKIIVGAPSDERSGGSSSSGLAYIYISSSVGWRQNAVLSGSLAIQNSDGFGGAVSINSVGDRVIVGAVGDERAGSGASSGLAYVFTSGSSGWTESAILSGSLAIDTTDYFGRSVSMNSVGDRVVVGTESDEAIGGSASMGLAYVFVSGNTGWTENAVLSGSLAIGADDWFGYSVAMNGAGDRVVVGAAQDERTGGSANSGLAYVFTSGSSGWVESKILSGSLAVDANDRFGFSVSSNSDGDRIIVGAYVDEKNAATASTGLAYMFEESTTELLDGIADKVLSTKNESVRLVSDGSGSWSII